MNFSSGFVDFFPSMGSHVWNAISGQLDPESELRCQEQEQLQYLSCLRSQGCELIPMGKCLSQQEENVDDADDDDDYDDDDDNDDVDEDDDGSEMLEEIGPPIDHGF